MLYPLFVIRSGRLFGRVLAAYAVVLAVSLLSFAVFPVTSVGFRADASKLDLSLFHNWGVRLTYAVDPPTNLFPSLHLSIATLAALAGWHVRRLFGGLAFLVVAGIAVSICTMKQHYVVDGIAALVLAGAAHAAVVRPFDRSGGPPSPATKPTTYEVPPRLAYTWRGPVLYLLFHLLVYSGLYVAFRAGVVLW